MKRHHLVPALILCSVIAFSQENDDQLKQLIYKKDSLFWMAYNACDVQAMDSFMSADVEFYHDKGGVTLGRDSLHAVISRNLCGNSKFRLRRKAVRGTVEVFLLKKSNATYGAIISGEHVFYVREEGKKEFLDGLAKFTQLWILKDGEWKMSRILSYNHHEAPKDIEGT